MKNKILAIMLLLSFVLLSCSQQEANKKINIVKIGVAIPLTGPSSDAGEYVRNGLSIAVDEINKEPNNKYFYQLIFEDSQYDPKIGVNAFRKLIDFDGVKYVIGEISSSVTLAMAPIAEENKVILISPASQSDKISEAGDYIFRTEINTGQETDFFVPYLFNKIGVKKIDLLVINTDYGKSVVKSFSERFTKLGGKIGLVQEFDSKETDFRSHLLKIKENGADYIMIASTRTSGALILKQAKELNLKAKFFATSIIEGDEIIRVAGNAAEELIYSYSYDSESSDTSQIRFRQKYKSIYGHENEVRAANAYDALKVLHNCIEQNDNNVDKVKSCLYGIKDYHGASGIFSFDLKGDVYKKFITKAVRNGKFVKIS